MSVKLLKTRSGSWVSPDFDDFQDVKPVRITHSNKVINKGNQKLWLEEDPPASVEDLAVHPKKIDELKNWIDGSLNRVKGKKFLLLTGPPGSGKSASVKVLAKEFNVDLREWTNQEKEWTNKCNYKELDEQEPWVNQGILFSNFLSKSSKYGNLFIHSKKSTIKKSMILVEEFPFCFVKNPMEFHEILRKYNSCCTCPIIFIVTNVNDKSIGRQLFTAEIQEELNITSITFNSAASKFLIQALNRVLNLRSKSNDLSSDGLPSKQYLQSVAEMSGGDIRNAINTLQFALTDGLEIRKKEKKPHPKKKLPKVNEEIDFIGCKDTKLILFRALGKVLYCKRKNEMEKDHNLPKHLKHHERCSLEENPEEIFERSASDASTFSLWLHHNCTPFFKQIDALSNTLQYVTEADILQSYWNTSNSFEDYCASINIRGMMHCVSENSNHAPSQSYRSLKSPAYFHYLQTSNERLRKAKELCRTVSCSDSELMTNLVPLTAKIFLSNNTGGDRVLKDVGLMYPITSSSRNVLNTSLAEDLNSSVLQELPSSQQNPDDAEEDFTIEEFED